MAGSTASAGPWTSLSAALRPSTLATIETLGFQQMTPVQAATIPQFLRHRDVVVEAVTGSGKTLAFVIPVIEILLRRETPLRSHEVGCIILTPTRELAKQIAEIVAKFTADLENIKHILLTGGTDTTEDINQFKEQGGHIVIATPGRLEEVFRRVPSMQVKELEVLIMDEADRLLNMGFEQSIDRIIAHLPRQRRTGLFSATLTDSLNRLVRAGLRNPVRIVVKVEHKLSKEEQKTPASLQNLYLICQSDEKLGQLIQFLKENPLCKCIVYFSTCACVDFFYKALMAVADKSHLSLWSLHGQMVPKRRQAVYQQFTEASSGALLCTDIAARGLDIPDVDWVIQYDPPQDPSMFVHRCGRTARLGREGHALLFLLPQEEGYIDLMNVRKVPVQKRSTLQGDNTILDKIRTECTKDRELFEKGTKAFVSFIRSYKEHEASHIFRFANLDLGRVARSFSLLRLPKMPELKNKKIDFQPTKVDFSNIKYKDKSREKQRIANKDINAAKFVKKIEEAKSLRETREKNQAWSKQKERKDIKKTRKEKREIKKAAIQAVKKTDGAGQSDAKAGSKDGANEHEDDDDADEDDFDSDFNSDIDDDFEENDDDNGNEKDDANNNTKDRKSGSKSVKRDNSGDNGDDNDDEDDEDSDDEEQFGLSTAFEKRKAVVTKGPAAKRSKTALTFADL